MKARCRVLFPLVVAALFTVGLVLLFQLWKTAAPTLEVSIDFVSAPGASIELGSLQADGSFLSHHATAEAISDAYAPHHYQFSVEVSPDSGAVEMLFLGKPDNVKLDPPESWANNGTYIIHTKPKEAGTVTFEGWHWGPAPAIAFTRDPFLGEVILRSGEHVRTISLKSEQTIRVDDENAVREPVPVDQKLYRYRATIPVVDERKLALRVADGTLPAIHRLYLNKLIPEVYYTGTAPDRNHTGRVFAHWSPSITAAGATLTIPSPVQNTWPLILAGVIIFLILVAGLLLLQFLLKPAPGGQDELSPFALKPLLAYWFILFMAWFILLVLFWPGTMNVDSLQQWKQAHEFKFDTQHPVLYALLFRMVSSAWDSPAPIVLLQIVALSGLLAWGFSLLHRARVPLWILWPCFLVTALSPKNATMVISLIKDMPFAIATTGVIVASLHLLLSRKWQERLPLWIFIGLCLALLPLLRHNGLAVTVGMAIILPLLFPFARSKAITASAIAIGLWCLIAFYLLPQVPTEKKSVSHQLVLGHLAILLDRDVPLSNSDYDYLDSLRPVYDRWNYNPARIEGTVSAVGIELDHETLQQRMPELLSFYSKLVAKNPLIAAQYFVERGEYIYVPWETVPIETYFLGISRNDMGLFNYDIVLEWPDAVRAFLAKTTRPAWNWLLWRPALPLYVCLGAMLALLWRGRPRMALVLFAPLWLGTLSLFIVPVAQTARYQFYLTLPAALLLACAFLPRGGEGGAV